MLRIQKKEIQERRSKDLPQQIFTWVWTNRILNAAEIFLRSYANAVVLIGKLCPNCWIEIEAAHSSIDAHMVLQTTLVGFGYTVTWYLCNSDAPSAWKCEPTGYHCQYDWITLTKSCVNIHWKLRETLRHTKMTEHRGLL